MKATITIRINMASYTKIKAIFPAYRKETMASYFERLSKWLGDRE